MSVEMFFQMSEWERFRKMKETRIIHSHTKNYVLCVSSPLVSFPEEDVGEGGLSIGGGMRGWGMKNCMMQSKIDVETQK